MKFTLSWLKQHLETDSSLEQIAHTLTLLGLEVDGIEDRAAAFAAFRTAKVLEATQHPDADKLWVCRVLTAEGETQVVCGDPNARTGLVGIFAPAGAYVPGIDLTLKATKIRGQASNGMLCSEKEVGLSDDHKRIIDLPADTPVGVPFAQVFGLDDPVIDIDLTPDRGDCASVRGVARDLAAAGLGRLKPDPFEPVPGSYACPITPRLALPQDHPTACSLFIGRHFRGLRNGPSPQWLQDRLKAVGQNPISALVDITNLMTLEYGRPLHVFDATKLTGGIHVRFAAKGESVEALDTKTYELDEGILSICDDAGVQGIAGVIGGAATGVQPETTEVFLETALFDPKAVAASGRRLGINSDARYRFERGVDPAFAWEGMERATRLILDLCGGEASDPVAAGQAPDPTRTLTLRLSRAASLGGVDVPEAEQVRILEALGFTIVDRDAETLKVQTPTWRPDIDGEADLVEEVLRVHGYDKMPATPMHPDPALPRPAPTPAQGRAIRARRLLAQRGLSEIVSWAFIEEQAAGAFGGVSEPLRLINPIIEQLQIMRPSLLPGLLQAAQRNADRSHGDVSLFEVGTVFGQDLPQRQQPVAAAVRAGNRGPRHWSQPAQPWDVFDAKADALALLEALGVATDKLQVATPGPAWYHPGRSGSLQLGPAKVLAHFGEVHPAALEALDVSGRPVAFELFLDGVPQPKRKPGQGARRPKLELSNFQPVTRDFAFLVSADLPADKVTRAIANADKQLISAVGLFDVYTGAGVPEGKQSLAVWVTLQPQTATLTDKEIEAVSSKIVAAVEKHAGGSLRG